MSPNPPRIYVLDRRYIENFSRIFKPIYDLVKTVDNKKTKASAKAKHGGQSHPNKPITLPLTHQTALERLIECLVSLPVMAYPDPNRPHVLHTDASGSGLGAVLYQRHKDVLCVVTYGSGTLTAAEKNYHLHFSNLEFLALVSTDKNPLTYVLSIAKLNAGGLRWVGKLADSKFIIRYRPGKENADAATLYRTPKGMDDYMKSCTEKTSQNGCGRPSKEYNFKQRDMWTGYLR